MVQNYTAFDMPLDVIWNDIDWMRDYVFGSYNDELGSGGYTLRDVRALNEYVAARQQKRVLIVDPNIPALLEDKDGKAYLPYVEGVAQGIFVRHPMNDSLLYGKQWPDASVAWPDFTHPGIVDWWEAQFTRLGALAGQMDGVWLDMVRPSPTHRPPVSARSLPHTPSPLSTYCALSSVHRMSRPRSARDRSPRAARVSRTIRRGWWTLELGRIRPARRPPTFPIRRSSRAVSGSAWKTTRSTSPRTTTSASTTT